MRHKTRELLRQAKGAKLLGGRGRDPALREEIADRVVGRDDRVPGLQGSIMVMKMSMAGAAVALAVALGVTRIVVDSRQEAAASVWSEAWAEDTQ